MATKVKRIKPKPKADRVQITLSLEDAAVLYRFTRSHVTGSHDGPRGTFQRLYEAFSGVPVPNVYFDAAPNGRTILLSKSE